MGNTKSKSTVSAVSKNISDVVSRTVQSCEVAAEQDQNLNVVNNGFSFWTSYTLKQESDISSTCFSNKQMQANLQAAVKNAIEQSAATTAVAFLPAFGSTKSEASANISTIVENYVTMENIQKQYSKIRQAQTANFTNNSVNLFQSVDLMQGSTLFAAATLKVLEDAGLFTTIENYAKQETSTEVTNPLDFIADIFSGVTGAIMWAILGFVILVVAIALGFRALR